MRHSTVLPKMRAAADHNIHGFVFERGMGLSLIHIYLILILVKMVFLYREGNAKSWDWPRDCSEIVKSFCWMR